MTHPPEQHPPRDLPDDLTVARTAGAEPPPPAPGPRVLLGIVPVEAEQTPVWDAADARLGVSLVPYLDIAALLVPPPDGGDTAGREFLQARHHEVHRALLRGTIAPAPPGIVFARSDDVVRFLTETYAALKGALARVENRWEFRLHIELLEPALSETLALDLVTHIYAELRRNAHAAIPFPHQEGRLLTAAFLVNRADTKAFRARVEELGRVNTALGIEMTGPWPPYDFVQMHGV